MTRLFRRTLATAATASVVLLGPAALRAQQGGTIAGRVRDIGNQQPLGSAQVELVGTVRGASTNDDGEYRLAGVAAGTYTLRVQRIGYSPTTRSVTVTNRQTLTADFSLTPTAIQIDEVVVTATGETKRKREKGNTVATVDPTPARVATSPTIAEMIQGQAAGVYVNSSGGTQGTASRIRIRGANSVSLTNEPLILVDGVRANNDITQTGTGN